MFIKNYGLNLLALPGRRVRCGSVYIKDGKQLTAPGELAAIVCPPISLPEPDFDPRMAELSGTWSGRVSVKAGFGLLQTFLTALGASGLVKELSTSIERTQATTIRFRFQSASRKSISPTALADVLKGREFITDHAWVKKGNRYFAVASVVSSQSLSIEGHDARDTAVHLGTELTTVGKFDGDAKAERTVDTELVYKASEPLAIAVELYELVWDEGHMQLTFSTPKGHVPVLGVTDDDPPDPVLIGDDEEALISPIESR
ncbi:MAG: hypothetical protein ACLP0J_23655 [Solirubrobacteraceae bacterium]